MSIRINVGATFDARDLKRAQAELDALKKQADTLGNRMNRMGDQFKDVGARVASVGSNMTRRVTLPLVGIGVAAARSASDFESSFAQIEGLVGVTGDDLERLKDAARELGPQFGASAGEAAEAMFFITSAGLRGAEAIETLESSLKAAASGLGDVATVADLATSVTNAYGSEIIDSAKATDILAAAVREGKLAPEELAGSIGSVLPLASAMGVNFNEVGAAFAAMSRTGTDASQAATQLRGIMSALLKPTVQAEAALEEMGLSSAGLRQQIKDEGLLSVLETLSAEFEGNDEAAAQVFGNVRALSGVLDLMGSNADGTREIFANMADTTGTLDGAFSVVSETAAFQFQQAMAEAKDALLTLGDIVLPVVRDLVSSFQGLIDKFRDLSPEQQEQIVKFAAIAAVMGPVLLIFGKVIAAVGSLIKGAVLLGKGIALLFTPMGAIVLAIAAVIAIGVLLWRNWDTISAKARELFQRVKDFFGRIRNSISETMARARQRFTDAIDGIRGAFNRARDSLNGALSSISGFFSRTWDTMKNKAKSAVNFIVGLLNGVIAGYERMLNAVGGGLNRLPFVGKTLQIPNWVPGVGGNSFSIPSVPRVTFPRIPMLADGGIVTQETLAIIGERGPEAVIPLDRLGDAGGGPSIVINVSGALDPEGTARTILRTLRDAERRTGERLVL
jgi:TP901 family phage tail tape measure protein